MKDDTSGEQRGYPVRLEAFDGLTTAYVPEIVEQGRLELRRMSVRVDNRMVQTRAYRRRLRPLSVCVFHDYSLLQISGR